MGSTASVLKIFETRSVDDDNKIASQLIMKSKALNKTQIYLRLTFVNLKSRFNLLRAFKMFTRYANARSNPLM